MSLKKLYNPITKKNDWSRGPGIGCISWFLIMLILLIIAALTSCAPIKVVVIDKHQSPVEENANYDAKQLYKKWYQKKITGFYAGINDYNVGDTVIINKTEFTNL